MKKLWLPFKANQYQKEMISSFSEDPIETNLSSMTLTWEFSLTDEFFKRNFHV